MDLFQPEKNSETRDTNIQTKLCSRHVKIKVPSSHQKSVLKSIAGKAITKVLPQPPHPASVSTGLLLILLKDCKKKMQILRIFRYAQLTNKGKSRDDTYLQLYTGRCFVNGLTVGNCDTWNIDIQTTTLGGVMEGVTPETGNQGGSRVGQKQPQVLCAYLTKALPPGKMESEIVHYRNLCWATVLRHQLRVAGEDGGYSLKAKADSMDVAVGSYQLTIPFTVGTAGSLFRI